MLIAASPSAFNAEETLAALRFAARAKQIRNAINVNVRRSAEQLEQIVGRLEQQMQFEVWFARQLSRQIDAHIESDEILDNNYTERRREAIDNYSKNGDETLPTTPTKRSNEMRSPSPFSLESNDTHRLRERCEAAEFQVRQVSWRIFVFFHLLNLCRFSWKSN